MKYEWHRRQLTNNKAYGPRRQKTCLQGFANNTGAYQPGHPRSLNSIFVIRFLQSTICKVATGNLWLITVPEETGLKLAFSETSKTGFRATWPDYYIIGGFFFLFSNHFPMCNLIIEVYALKLNYKERILDQQHTFFFRFVVWPFSNKNTINRDYS